MGKTENTQNVDGVGMVLKRIELEDKKYPVVLNDDGTLNEHITKRFPKKVYDWYKIMEPDQLKEYNDTPDFWATEGIQDVINNYLAKEKIKKEDLHSIETKLGSMIEMRQDKAVIIYEDRN